MLDLAAPKVCAEMAEALELLITQAKKGELISMSCAVLHKRFGFQAYSSCSVLSSPNYFHDLRLLRDQMITQEIHEDVYPETLQ
ncbi:MAG: hypothetical protein H7274_12030 [Rhodoferax sp.]|nr:hypothetical protein [Rhodoferax sp.]